MAIQNRKASSEIHNRFRKLHRLIACLISGSILCWIFVVLKVMQQTGDGVARISSSSSLISTKSADKGKSKNKLQNHASSASILHDLTDEQRNPSVGKRWMVRPPSGGNLHLMFCNTTKGSFHILLHKKWAPIGVPHLLAMLERGYFNTTIPLFRCTDACQFGLSSNASLTKEFAFSIPDDPLWLPTGPENRFSSSGNDKIKRYPKGVLTHAGGGKDSRGTQFVLTLKPNKFMGGGSPWEVPLGEVVEFDRGEQRGPNINDPNKQNRSFVDVSLPDFYTGYGEKGPGQGLLRRKGVSDAVRENWPLLDYVLRCSIVDQFLEGKGTPGG